MNNIIESFNKINSNIKKLQPKNPVNIVAVSKTFSFDYIKPLIDYGHTHFGENKVQEALSKWTEIKKQRPNINLHMIGKLQSNKAKAAVNLFDYIHSLDSQKLADVLSKSQSAINRSLNYFIQVNIGNETQKSGITKEALKYFYEFCFEINLNVVGLMCIPPADKDPSLFFEEMNILAKELNLKELSMGMSADYIEAVEKQSTYLRIGSAIFGSRN